MSNRAPTALPPLPPPIAYRWYESKWGDYSYSDAPRMHRENEPIYTAEQVEAIRRGTVQACAAIAEALVTQHWQDYKRGPHRADPHYQGMSDGAQEVFDAILALLPVKEPT